MNTAWLEVFKIIIANLKSVRGLSKALAKFVVKFLLKYSGPQGFITSLILEKIIKYGIIEGRDIIQKNKDNKTIKIGDYLEQMPATDEIKRKRKENLKKLIEG